MEESALRLVGRVDGQCIFIRRQEMPLDLSETILNLQSKCVVLDFLSGKVSHQTTLVQISEVCPFKIVTSGNEAEVLIDLVEELMPKGIMGVIENIMLEKKQLG